MEYQTAFGIIGISVNGGQTGFVSLLSACQNLLDLPPFVTDHHLLYLTIVQGVGDNGNLINQMVVIEHIDRMLDDSLAGNLEELLGSSQSRTGTYSSCQNHCYVFAHMVLL